MQDFYNSIPDFNSNSPQPAQADITSQGSDGRTIYNYDAIRQYSWDEWQGFDWLSNRYPRYKDRIQELRYKGIPDRIISRVFSEQVEPRLNFTGNKEQVNNFLGRTSQTLELDRRYEQAKRFNAYRQAFPDKSEQEISDALWLAQDSGVAASTLLQYPELAKKLTAGRPMHYQIFGDKRDSIPEGWSAMDIFMDRMLPKNSPLRMGWHNFSLTRQMGELGNLAINGKISREEALQKKKDLAQQFLPQPINQSGVYPYLEGASSIMAQGVSTGTKSGTVLLGASLLAPYLGVPAAAGQIGAWLMGGHELWKLSAGNKYLELLEMKDKEGKPIDENAARVGAILDGAGTIATEMIGLPTVSRLLGINKLFGFQDMVEPLIDAARSNPIVSQAFENLGKQYAKGVWWGAINNTIESVLGDIAVPLAQKISGQPFVPANTDILGNASHTFFKSLGDFAIAGAPNIITSAYRLGEAVRDSRLWLQEKIVDPYNEEHPDNPITVKEVEQSIADKLQEAQQAAQQQIQAVDQQIQQSQQTSTTQEQQQDTTQEAPLPQPETPTDETTTDIQVSSPARNSDYVFVPTEELQNFIAKNEGLDLQGTFESGKETAIPRVQFDKLKAEHPEFTDTILNNTRYGADGVTTQEAMDKINTTDPEKAMAYYSPEIQEFIHQEAQQLEKTDMPPEQAENAAKVFGAFAAAVRTRFGVDILPSEVRTLQELEAQQQRDTAMMQQGYDITDPRTWVNTDRAKAFVKALQGKLSDFQIFIRDALNNDGKLQDIDIEGISETDKKSATTLLRQEIKDYSRAISTANQDTVKLLRERTDLDADLFVMDTTFPKGKSRNPDHRYEYDNYGGKTTIDVAEKNNDLFIKAKAPGTDKPFVFAIKNFVQSDLRQVLDDLGNAVTDKGLEIARAPVFQSIVEAMQDFWHKQGLPYMQQLGVQGEKIDNSPEVHSVNVAEQTSQPEVHTLDIQAETSQSPEVHQMEIPTLEAPQMHTLPLAEVMPENVDADALNQFQARMPQLAQDNLAVDAQAWSDTTEDILTDPNISAHSQTKATVMQTPLVFDLAGMQGKQLLIKKNKLAATKESIMQKHGDSITLDMVKDIVPKLANPIAIFEDSENASQHGKVVLIDMKDKNGASVIVPVVQDGDNLRIASAYSQAETRGKKKGQPKNQWFRNAVLDGRLLYINTEKAEQWAQDTGVALIEPGENIPEGVKTQLDLQSAWNEHRQQGYYFTDPDTGQRRARISIGDYGRSLVQLLVDTKGGKDFAIHVHEIGHAMFGVMDEIATSGNTQMLADRDYVIKRAGFTVEQWLKEKQGATGGVREKVHEWFADAFTVYLAEGKAPTAYLQDVFDRSKKFLLEVYNDITHQLGITLNDNDRELFHRLLSEPGKETDTVTDFAVQQNSIQQEIDRLEGQKRSILEQQALANSEASQEGQSVPELDEDIARQIQDFVDRSNDLAQDSKGNISRVVTGRGTEVETRYKVVEADQLITSHNEQGKVNPDFPQELQPRQRNRAASRNWIRKNAGKLDPELLAESRLASNGAPIIGSDNIVESGNGRVLLIRQAYNNSVKGLQYQQWLEQNAQRFGLDPQQISQMKQPVLVRERLTDIDRSAFTREANESSIATMSQSEQAINDANKLTTNILTAYDPNKPLAANTEFLQAFARIIPDTELGGFMQENGEVSRAGIDRVISALMAKAYGEPSLINNITESIGSDISNVVNALISAAPSIAVFQSGQYNPELSIGNDIVQAVQALQMLRREGRTVQEWITQPSLFGEEISDAAKSLLQFFDNNKNSYKRIAVGLRTYATEAMQEAHTGQFLLFEDSARDKATILQQAISAAEVGEGAELVEPVSAALFERFSEDGKVSPTIPVNHNTFNHFLALTGARGTMQYLKQRKKFLNASAKRKANAKAELERINHYIKQLENTYHDELKEGQPNITKKDLRKARLEGRKEGRRAEYIKQAERQDNANQRAEVKSQKKIQSLQEENFSAIQEMKQSLRDERLDWQQRLYEQQQEAQQKQDALRLQWQERLERTMHDMDTARTEAIDKANKRARREVAKLQKRIDNLSSTRRTLNEKHGIKRTVKRIISMGKSKNILWDRHVEIQNIIERLDRDKSPEAAHRREILRQFLELKDSEQEGSAELIEQLADEQGITQEEINEFTSKIHLADMTLAEVRELAQQVKDIFQQGRREYDIWKEQQRLKSVDMFSKMETDIINNTKEPDKLVPTESKDLNRKYWGGEWGEIAIQYKDAVITPGRFLEHLGESFREIFGDDMEYYRGQAYKRIHQRKSLVWEQLEQLGLKVFDFTKTAIDLNGQKFSWQQVMEIYAAMKNEYSRDAVIFGNFVGEKKAYPTLEAGIEAINQILELINQPENSRYKQATDIIMQDFSDNFDYINDALIRNFNRGMEQQDFYTPIFRLVHQGSGGLLIEENSDSISQNNSPDQLLAKVADGFTQSRVKIAPEKQQPINLNLINNWYKAMQIQEFNAALDGPAALMRHALLGKGGQHGSIQSMIKQRYGAHAWQILRGIFNNSISDASSLEMDAASKIASYLMQARSFAFVAFSPVSALSQTSSLALALPYSNRGHLFRSLVKFFEMGTTGRYEQFMESVYENYPELRFSGGDVYTRQLMQAKQYTSPAMSKYLSMAYAGVQFFDRVTKAIVFDAVYQSRLEEGLSHEDAVRLAIRACQDTQPASAAHEMANIFQTDSMSKLMFLQFMNALTPVLNVGIYDVARNLASRKWNKIKAAAWSIVGTAIAIGVAGALKDAAAGRLPTGEELPNGEEDTWGRWFADTTIENLINTVPIFNSVLTGQYRKLRHKPSYSPISRISEPVENIVSAFAPLTDDDEDTGFNWDKAIRGATLLGVRIPYSGGKQLLQWLGAFDDE